MNRLSIPDSVTGAVDGGLVSSESTPIPGSEVKDPWHLPRGGQLSDEERRDKSQSAQRQRILFGMQRCCVEFGYSSTSVASVLAIAKVSRKTFYEQFDSKEDCFLTLFQRTHEALFELMVFQSAQHTGWEEQLRAGYRAYIQFFSDEPDLAAVMVESRASSAAAIAMNARGRRRFARLFEAFYEMRREEVPALPAAPADMFLLVISGIDSLLADRVRNNNLDLEELEPVIGMLCGAIFATELVAES